LTEKSFRVAFPLFQFQYWLWMNRVSLVAHVLESISLLVVSLSSPFKSGDVQYVAWVLFHTFHLLHVFSHFQTFGELKRAYHSGLVLLLRRVLNAAVASVLGAVLFRVAFALTSLSALESAANCCEWIFFVVTFLWHYTVQREFIAPEDTRLYVGRRIALGASVRCSECTRPFSKSRTRETCADCRDECCIECGSEVHLAELGASVDMTLFCCSKCHRLLLAEVSASRTRNLMRPSARGTQSGTANAQPSEGMEVCRMFQRGECSYGETCRYLHVRVRSGSRPSRPQASGNNSSGNNGSSSTTSNTSASTHNTNNRSTALKVAPLLSSGGDPRIVSDSDSLLDSSSGLDSLSSIERKKRRRGKRGQRKKKIGTQTEESDGYDEIMGMMQEAEVNDEELEKDQFN
jgi:hypothetical protein